MSKDLILVVCRGNIGRSPFAEAILKREIAKHGLSESVEVMSRGVQGTTVDPEPVKYPNITHYKELYDDAKPALNKFGVDLSQHSSTPVSKVEVTQARLVLAMDRKTLDALHELFPWREQKMHLITELIGSNHDITDPEGVSGAERQEKIFSEIEMIIRTGFSRLEKLLGKES